MKTIDEAIESIWKDADPAEMIVGKNRDAKLREITRYASLAASSHNTQPWKFHIEQNRITVFPDVARATPVVDPNNHHLFVSLGCAVENLVIAAKAHGLEAKVDASNPQTGIVVALEPCKVKRSALFEAIPKRQCTRNLYDGQPLDPKVMRQLQDSGTGKGVRAVIVTDPERIKIITDYVVEANTIQFNNKDFTKEVKEWVRFGDSEAIAKGDGLQGRCMGNDAPSIPRWLGELVFDLVVGPDNTKLRQQIASSAGIVLFVSDQNDAEHWVEVGRCYERFALQATSLEVKNAMINQPVEVSDVRSRFQESLHLNCARVDLVVRFGYGKDMPRSLRRAMDDVIVVT